MAKKVIKRILCLYFVVSFIMMVSCLCIVIWDCVEKVCYGEFRLLPVLNVVEFKSNGTLDEQDSRMLEKASEYLTQLEMNGYGRDDALWSFINVSTAIALCNLPFYYLLRLFKVQLPHWLFKIFIITSGIALLLMLAVRIFVRTCNCYGATEVKLSYPAAYPTWRELFVPVVVLPIMTFFVKLMRE